MAVASGVAVQHHLTYSSRRAVLDVMGVALCSYSVHMYILCELLSVSFSTAAVMSFCICCY